MQVNWNENDLGSLKMMSDLMNDPDHDVKEWKMLASHFAAVMVGRYRYEMERREMMKEVASNAVK